MGHSNRGTTTYICAAEHSELFGTAEHSELFARHTGMRGCRRLRMLPDSFSHLHYLHHVFHHQMGEDCVKPALCRRHRAGFVFAGVYTSAPMRGHTRRKGIGAT